ncbi:MAG TPA: Gfo/Idh/MocA family oxidoreductase [Phycisphaerae bacterium]|nr:Gfo/Idh/MocA family oxidoreductase [Phycisphaerae bacterium]
MPKMLKVGVVGFQRGMHLATCLRHVAGAELAAVCDLRSEVETTVREGFPGARFFTDYGDLLGCGVDAVMIASPPQTHADYTIRALDRGLHVLCEVPAFHERREMAPLVRAVRHTKAVYMFAENVLYWAFVHSVRQRIKSGDLGRIMYAEAEYVHDVPALLGPGSWRRGYPPIQYCTHSLGPVLEWMDDGIVTAVALHTGVQRRPDLESINMEAALFRTESGSVIKLLCGFSVAREPAFHRYVLYGTGGYFEKTAPMDGGSEYFLYTEREGPGRPVRMPFSQTWASDADDPQLRAFHGGADYRMVKDFVESILEGRPSPVGIDKAVRMTLPGICAHESAEQGGRPVAVEADL